MGSGVFSALPPPPKKPPKKPPVFLVVVFDRLSPGGLCSTKAISSGPLVTNGSPPDGPASTITTSSSLERVLALGFVAFDCL